MSIRSRAPMPHEKALDAGAAAAYGEGYECLSDFKRSQCRAAVRPIVAATIGVTAEYIAEQLDDRADMFAKTRKLTVAKEFAVMARWMRKWRYARD